MNLVGIRGVADMIGLQPSTVYVMRSLGKLPVPDVTVEGKPLWHPDTIEKWDESRVKHVAGRGPRR